MSEVAAEYDIFIAGGGMIGSSLAAALASLELSVAMVEAVDRGAGEQPSFDERSTALSRSTQRSFAALGLWQDIAAASTPIARLHVSDKGRFGFAHLDAAEQGVEALGYVCRNRVLGAVLATALKEARNLVQYCPARITGVSCGCGTNVIAIRHADGREQRLAARLLVVADGARSTVRDMLGIGVMHSDYGQTAIAGSLLTERPADNVAYERFTEDGPIAMLPIGDARTAFVWIAGSREASRLVDLDDTAFTAELEKAFGHRLGGLSRPSRRTAYPLALSRAVRVTADRAVLIGNAAHGLHPVAAQGFNLGLRDVATLCDCIADALDGAADIGARPILERYAAWRRADQRKLVAFTDGLVRLFGSRRTSLRLLRNLGMLGFDLIPGVKRSFARHTMGLAGRLPRLARGVPLRNPLP